MANRELTARLYFPGQHGDCTLRILLRGDTPNIAFVLNKDGSDPKAFFKFNPTNCKWEMATDPQWTIDLSPPPAYGNQIKKH